ncbi:hypothetical protein N7474_003272 [Penicillium riverlandense]|uniref:uncharacterized protein n=1 Tax=Penicillium riverlandense TaxID=1903569 RepID=UPI0025470223|nr:uncharacterized protein N7474_003272 [Penicillium riverlandense]KAJ5826134.1 hypothetical protein N7474_003272 [Penicillium riverlandense]
MPGLPTTLLALAGTITVAHGSTQYTVQYSSSRPEVAVPLPQNLCGLSIEPDRWPDWAGNGTHRNEFTYTLLSNLKEKTGVAPRIRVGGDTQDAIHYEPSLTGSSGFYDVFPPIPTPLPITTDLFPEATFVGAGPDFWLSSCNLPAGTAFTWGVNFLTNASEAVAQVREIESAFADHRCKNVSLYNIELGNEMDLQDLGDHWGLWAYKTRQIEFFNMINNELKNNGRKYRIGDFAEYWTSEQLLATNIMQSPMGEFVNSISEHHYQSGSKYNLTSLPVYAENAEDLVNKANIRSNLAPYAASAHSAQRAGIPFVLGETNSFSGHGSPGVSNAAAQALWMIDYSLQAASIGATGIYYHQGVGYNYSAWEPINHIGGNVYDYEPSAKRHVMPLYYGYLAVADTIGNSGDTYINELWTGNDNLTAYQIWEGKDLKRIMLLNEQPWTELSEGTRPVMSVNLPTLAATHTKATYKRLEFESLSALSGLTWGGQSWENYEGKATGKVNLERVGSDGTIPMNASSAVLIYL